MTFDDHWQKVRSANPKLADDRFARALAEAAWEAATKAEREACAERARVALDRQAAPAHWIGLAVRAAMNTEPTLRSNGPVKGRD